MYKITKNERLIMQVVTTGQFRQNFSEYVDIAKFKEPITITQHGKPTVMVLSYEDGIDFLEKKRIQQEFEAELETEREMFEVAAEALRHYQETGLHTTHEEMKEWARKLITNPNEPIPKCHK